ncbi:TlpA family protein disulfide reductase [Planctomicrobium sp. SH661]|uniref:TlpA family protein disulfide reductase n=1 Tax=Planctomicrobium sp. SH661 TaxID=3448124 RepID=UPI003F5B11E7
MLKSRLLILTLVTLVGCKPAPPAAPAPEPASPPSAPAPEGQSEGDETGAAKPAMTPVEGIQLDVLNWEETLALVKQHPGKVVVMDLWATYCPPCIAEFPNLVRLNREHGDKVACISVSTDYDGLEDQPVESYREKVMKFLTKQEATFQNVLLSISAEQLFAEKVEQQSIPIVFVFDQKGNLRGQFPNPKEPAEFTYQEQILPLVEKLLKNE